MKKANLAKKIVVGCGSKSLPWEVLHDLIVELMRAGIQSLVQRNTVQNALEIGYLLGCAAVLDINIFRKNYDPDRGVFIGRLLDASRLRVCKEPVDHLWGMFGLMDPVVREKIQSSECVDYTDTGTSLHTFSTTRSFLKPQQIPSWCPN
jgi:hypothetical protein